MLGLGATFTAKTTGKIVVSVDGTIICGVGSGPGSGIAYGLYYGPTGGVAPANQAALTGSALGATQIMKQGATFSSASVAQPFALRRFAQGLTVGQVYWFDLANLSLQVSVGSRFNFQNTDVVIVELP